MPAPGAETFLLYGSYGYTGRLIAGEAIARGMAPVLAGRDRAPLEAQAALLGLPFRVISLDDPAALGAALEEVKLVVHAAGPFSRTSRPMADACLRTRRHYVDVTGELDVFEALAARSAEAREAGVMLLPGAGFDVVPSDCLAAHVKHRLPAAERLVLAFVGLGVISGGTSRTAAENPHKSGVVRRRGALAPLLRPRFRTFDFGDRTLKGVTIAWGDVSTAYASTGIGDIEVYSAGPVRVASPGPSAEERARGKSVLLAEAHDASGACVVSRLETPEAYALTATTAVAIAREVLAGRAPHGFQTPSSAYGKDFILRFPGVTRADV